MSDDTPTVPFGQPAGQPSNQPHNPGPGATPPAKKSRRPLVFIIILAALVLLAIVAIIILLVTRAPDTTAALNTASATPTDTPTPTASATPTPTPSHTSAPPATGLQFTSYSISPLTIDCSASAPASAQYLTIKWTSLNGQQAYFGVNTMDAKANGMGWNLPPSGSNHDFPSGNDPYSYLCGNSSMTYTITIVGANGTQQSKTITVTRQ